MIFKDALLVTPRSGLPPDALDARIASVGIEGGIIKAVGPYDGVRRRCPQAVEEIDCQEAGNVRYIVLPGFVDAHCHSRQMALHGYSESGWRDQRSKPRGEREIRDLFGWFLLEAVKAGLTFVCDWPEHLDLWTPKPLDEELQTMGLRGCIRVLLPHNRGEPWPELAEAADRLRQTRRGLDDRVQLGIWIPEEDKREFNDATLQMLARLQQAAGDCPLWFQMHLAESKKRKAACNAALRRLLDHGLVRPGYPTRTVFIHAIWIDPAELETLAAMKDRVGVVTCPKFADGGVAPIKELLAAGIPVGLGSDVSVPDQFELIARLIAIHQGREESRQLSFAEAFYIATLGGARVFGLEDRIGSIEEGKDADLVVVKNPAAIDPALFQADDGDSPRRQQQRQKIVQRLFLRNVLRKEHVNRVTAAGRVVLDGGLYVSRNREAAIEAAGKRAALAIVKRLAD